jgi:site-specific DNA-methyltransferase (adenine-specific)
MNPIFVVGSSERARTELPNVVGKVSLAVTSPPYHNAISYESHQEDSASNYRTRAQIDYAGEYLALLDRVWTECWHMLRPGGHLAVNVGTVLDQGFHFPLPQDVESQLCNADVKWDYIRSIIWNKVTAGVKRAGSVIQHKLPGYWYPNIMSEHIVVVRKPGRKVVLNHDVPTEWWENIWDLAPVPPRQVEHPAPFPEDLPHRLIRMLTLPGDLVLDPFNGAGATTKAAYDLGRVGIGFDLSRQYNDYARARIELPSSVRTNQLHVVPIASDEFVAGKSRGATRHGSGLNARRHAGGSK